MAPSEKHGNFEQIVHKLATGRRSWQISGFHMTYPLLISTGFLKYPLELKKKFSYNLTEIFFQFEINAEMDISKNQWRSTGG